MMAASGGVSPTGVEGFYDQLADDLSLTIDELNDATFAYDGPLRFDPRPYIRTLTVPTLWVYGRLDRSHPVAYDIRELEVIGSETDLDITILLYENVNHDLIDETSGELPTTLLADMFGWLDRVAGGQGGT